MHADIQTDGMASRLLSVVQQSQVFYMQTGFAEGTFKVCSVGAYGALLVFTNIIPKMCMGSKRPLQDLGR